MSETPNSKQPFARFNPRTVRTIRANTSEKELDSYLNIYMNLCILANNYQADEFETMLSALEETCCKSDKTIRKVVRDLVEWKIILFEIVDPLHPTYGKKRVTLLDRKDHEKEQKKEGAKGEKKDDKKDQRKDDTPEVSDEVSFQNSDIKNNLSEESFRNTSYEVPKKSKSQIWQEEFMKLNSQEKRKQHARYTNYLRRQKKAIDTESLKLQVEKLNKLSDEDVKTVVDLTIEKVATGLIFSSANKKLLEDTHTTQKTLNEMKKKAEEEDRRRKEKDKDDELKAEELYSEWLKTNIGKTKEEYRAEIRENVRKKLRGEL